MNGVQAMLFGMMLATASSAVNAIVIGQLDTFESGTTEGWFAGGGPLGATPPVLPEVIPTGGPGGVDDAFLQVTAFGGTGPGSRLVTMNAAQWAGDYVAAGVNSIRLDLRNLGTTDLIVRLFFEDPIPGPPVNVAVSALGATLPAGGGWTHVTFDLASLTPLMGDTSTLLGDTTLVRIIHAAAAGAAEPVVGVLGIDNVLAIGRPVTVDEPPSALLVACALLVLLSLRIRRPRDFLAADRF